MRLHLTKKLEILSKLREVTRPVPDQPGKVAYSTGWNDQIIASACGVGSQSVKTIRQSELGVLIERGPYDKSKSEAEPDIEALIRGAVIKIVTPISARSLETLNKIIAAQEQLNIRVNGLSSEIGVAIAEINKRLGERMDRLSEEIDTFDDTVAKIKTELEARRPKPNPVIGLVKDHAELPKTLLADKLREAAARIETSEA